jgi:hypothetical protein
MDSIDRNVCSIFHHGADKNGTSKTLVFWGEGITVMLRLLGRPTTGKRLERFLMQMQSGCEINFRKKG